MIPNAALDKTRNETTSVPAKRPIAFGGIEASGRLIDDDQFRISQQRLRDTEALLHAAGKSAEVFPAHFKEIGLLQQHGDDFLPLLCVGEAFQNGEMIEHHFRRNFGIDAKLLRQVA